MPWLPVYATEDDVQLLLGLLNDDPAIAFIVGAGARSWRATSSHPALSPGRYCLWHVPSGPLPLLRPKGAIDGVVADPFAGWREERAGADPSHPYFGAGHPGVIWFNVRPTLTRPHSELREIGLSSFAWIGNWYRIIGSPAPAVTEAWWKALRRWVKKHAIKVPRGGLQEHTPPEIWAFPAAHQLLSTTAVGGNNP